MPNEDVQPSGEMRTTAFNFEPFNLEVTSFKRWVQRFETAVELFQGGTARKQKLILHYMGAIAYNILCDKITPRIPEELQYREIVELLTEHYDPQPNEILENYRFHLRKQKQEENCAQFLIALRRLAGGCNFGSYLDTALRNQFVFGLANQRIQSRLLEEKNLTLATAENMASAYECAERGGAEIQRKEENVSSVNKLTGKEKNKKYNKGKKGKNCNTQQQDKGKCYRCGITGHLANECKHKNTICNFCKIKGHLRKVCLKEKQQTTNQISTEKLQTVEELFQIGDDSKIALRKKILRSVKVNNVILEFEVDTGAPVTIISLADAKKNFANSEVKPSDTKLYSYCGTELDCMGYIDVDVTEANGGKLKMYIVRSENKPLMGREWVRQLDTNWQEMLDIKVNAIESGNLKIVKNMLIKKWPNLFSEKSGKISGFQARLHMKPGTTPKAYKARRLAFSLWEPVERELQKQVDEGLLIKVDRSEWATPIVVVQKSDGAVRICGDYKVTINQHLVIDDYPLPTIDELFSTMAGGHTFSKIDLSKAYLQLEVHPDDRHYLTLATHKGIFQPTRLMFGIACAPAIWQRWMEQLLSDIPGVSVFLDDIKITAPDDKTHVCRIEEVLRRLDAHNMRVNLDKSEFLQESIEYCGYVIDKYGIRKMESKIQAIQEMPQPTNKDEVRSWLGLVNYYGRFIENLSTIVYPLNQLLQNNTKFHFDAKCLKAFTTIKQLMGSDVVLTHFDTKLPLILAVDASPVGVGAVLSHKFKDGTERPIQFASQTLSKVQKNYSQIDKEAYAIVFGVKRFYQYLYGRKFTLVTDNKPLSQIFSTRKGLPTHAAMRMQHYALFLSSFQYEIQVKKSAENSNADAMSRLPCSDTYRYTEEIYIIEAEAISKLPITLPELQQETSNDKSVKNLMQCLRYGRNCESSDRFGIQQIEFTLHEGCLFRGIRVYIPKILRPRILAELHTAHFGISRMKALARAYCWWAGMDDDITKLVANCTDCQKSKSNPVKLYPVHVWMRPKKVFERVHVDYAGPFLGKYLFVLVDAYTKWPEVHILQNMTASTTIQKCEEIFAAYGLPDIIVSDHGTQFNSSEFQQFLKENGILHKQGAPYHPATNGQAERFVQTVKNKLKASNCSGSSMQRELSKILMAYRRAVHPTTNQSPAMLMFGRNMQTKLDLITRKAEINGSIQSSMAKKSFSIGERVAVRDYLSEEKWKFGRITKMVGTLHYEVLLDDKRTWKRHVDQMRRVGENVPSNDTHRESLPLPTVQLRPTDIIDEPAVSEPTNRDATEHMDGTTEVQKTCEAPPNSEPRRSQRKSKPPDRLQYI